MHCVMKVQVKFESIPGCKQTPTFGNHKEIVLLACENAVGCTVALVSIAMVSN